jgi:hypothetical protein
MKTLLTWLLLCSPTLCLPVPAAGFRAGTARVKITPELPFWLIGYAARTHPATKVVQDIYAKALALDDGQGGRVVIVTTDVLGLPSELSQMIAERAEKQFGLKRSQLLMNSSHTHTGPALWPNLRVFFDFDAAETERAKQYALGFVDKVTAVIGDSLKDLSPARVDFGTGEAGFAINRRLAALQKLNPGKSFPAPVDHSVPVWRVTGLDGRIRALLFAYACHNTTLTGEFYVISGDYAGFAQAALEQAHPGANAMFLQLCGADQNPYPRSKLELAEAHGQELSDAVEKVLQMQMKELRPLIRTSFETTRITFAPTTRETFEAELKTGDVFHQRRAKLMLEAFDRGHPIHAIDYPVQAVRWDRGLTLLALAGEVVVDYDLRAKREYSGNDLVVAGYSNTVMSYIPSRRVLDEGGYEAVDSMTYYSQPGPYTDDVEETIFSAIHRVMASLGIHPGKAEHP